MKKSSINYTIAIGLVTTLLTYNNVMAAEFVVQTDLDTGGGLTIAEISPEVFTIDTLRSAIEQANDEVNFPGPDIISFDANIIINNPTPFYTTIILSQMGGQFNFQGQSTDSALGIDSVITIKGTLPGASELPIKLEAAGLRHFQVNNSGKLRLNHLSLYNGETPINVAGWGGAVVVQNNAQLEINGCDFRFNEAVFGGAVAFSSGSLDSRIEHSQFLFNSANNDITSLQVFGWGGAIFADLGMSSLMIKNTEISSNTADASAGAIYTNRSFEIHNSTFESNYAGLDGGALYVNEQAIFTISNSLFDNNEGNLFGGAIYNGAETFNAGRIFNSTLTRNIAGWGSATRQTRGLLTAGGAIYTSIADNLLMHNSIIADNKDTSINDDVSAALSPTSSFNLIGVAGDMTGVTHNTNNNLIGTTQQPIDPGLKIESFSIIGLKSNSPAVNSGSNAQVIVAALSTDIEGNDRVIGSAVDRGAHETEVFFYNGFE